LHAGYTPVDERFDQHLPAPLRQLSPQYWTPLSVTRKVGRWLTDAGARHVLDVGSGVGKFCVAGALTTGLAFTGLEQRQRLVGVARELANTFRVGARVSFIHGDLDALPHEGFDTLYFYNPFGEHLFSQDSWIDSSVELGKEKYCRDIGLIEQALDRMPVGMRIVTYNGFGGRIPDSYALLRIDRTTPNLLRLWVKTRAQSSESRGWREETL
jgi:predicted RNA methylase